MTEIIESKCTLYLNDLYVNKNIDYIISSNIREYDIKEAGWNLLQYYHLLNDTDYNRLSVMSKNQRHIEIGKMQKYDNKLIKKLNQAFSDMRKKFFKENNLANNDILSIHKDSIFTVNKKCTNTEFKNIIFKNKNNYTSFYLFNNIEMYYNSSLDILDIKGINDEKLKLHDGYMIDILKEIFNLLESGNKSEFIKFIKKLIYLYKNRLLDIHYYRELNASSVYTFKQQVNQSKFYTYGFNELSESNKNDIDISYNYMHYIFPIIQNHYFNEI